MDFLQVVEQRRAVRHYRAASIDRAHIERLIGTAILAPSAMNLQPWKFAVVSDAMRINEYARRAKEHLIASAAVSAPIGSMLLEPTFNLFYHAPVLVLVVATSTDEQAREDCCLAAQTFMLAARQQGLGTCWIGLARPWLNLPETKAELAIGADCHVVAPIVLGYPVEWPEPSGRRPAQIQWIGET